MARIISADEAIGLIADGATVLVNPMPSEEVYGAFGRVFEASGHPKDLTVVWSAGLGPFSTERKGMNHFAYPGMTKRIIAGHIGLNHLIVGMIASNQCEAFNLPQGVLTQLCRDIAARRPGLISSIGLGTFVDPRIEGGKMNERTRDCEDLVEVIQIGGEEFLLYKTFRADVGIIRATSVDPYGNLTCENEALRMGDLEVAMAAKNCGGIVIAQVERVSDTPAFPHHVSVPGILVDYAVVATSRPMHPHTLFSEHEPSFTGAVRVPLDEQVKPLPLGIEKVICRRAACELQRDMLVNLGIGIPMSVASVTHEEGFLETLTMTTEIGVIGGLPEHGFNFGPARNPTAFISQPQMFDFYDGGGLDLTCVGLAQADKDGNVNVSKLGSKVVGAGGFIDITQSARKCLFCGEFAAGGLDAVVEDGKLNIRQDGKVVKFVDSVQQITFSGKTAAAKNQEVLFITERCVFQLTPDGMLLKEIAPGVDLETHILSRMQFKPIVPDELPLMNPALFLEPAMGLWAKG